MPGTLVEKPFNIAVSDDQIDTLQQKLALTRFPDELDDAGRDYGVPLADVQRLVHRWRSGYDWKEHEAKLNEELPQFTTDIEVDGFGSLNIHYVHKRSQVEGAIPLLFVHGWPGSFLEVRKILPLLTSSSPDHPSFHVVALSLPGYGFSEAPKKTGFRIVHYAEVGNKLMLGLGYTEYVTQGGDLGYYITRKMATEYGTKPVKAWHTNTSYCQPPTLTRAPLLALSHLIHATSLYTAYTKAEVAGLERNKLFEKKGRGYYLEQATQPQTLGYSLADSPVGLLAWIYEKLVNWTDEYPWDDDEILTWISVYWFSRDGPAASSRIYYEMHNAQELVGIPFAGPVPMGVSYFPKEPLVVPKSWMRTVGNIVFEGDHSSGGHFAAHEKPEELVHDLRKMFGKGGAAFGVVPDKSGYSI
ncbi:hypothetical protein JAAARDRAFT_340408 [Jaapia argillacea MUCL 33604]|uniref:Epoxide hydrolase N-terminal domain-containing protein n=1 Tax=Jaapia argillacea MUCL 33604 TaxID=933084 RepID=A0A067PJI5_9AGAM|nr:hypothetical protein JAAARDRAFT_340408 [Jaapia argillacea MUCL 33604]